MRRISFNPRFLNEAGNNLVPGKIHTIRQNYDYWKKFEGKEVALFTWQGKPYQKGSTQKVFCIKRLVSVQRIGLEKSGGIDQFYIPDKKWKKYSTELLAKNDGFTNSAQLFSWFMDYPSSYKMAILHFTDYRY